MNVLADYFVSVLAEYELKVGFLENKTVLYYKLESLNNILNKNYSCKEMLNYLNSLKSENNSLLKNVLFDYDNKEIFTIIIDIDLIKYVHNNIQNFSFLNDLLDIIKLSNIDINDIKKIFYKYSNNCCFEQVFNKNYDYYAYFIDDIPDNFVYCFHKEANMYEFHRFIKSDFDFS